MKPLIAVYPGTFDPVTLGHLDIVRRGQKLCDQLIIGVAKHTGKNALFSHEKRLEMLQKVIAQENMPAISVLPINHLTVDFMRKNQATLIIRGLRTLSDFDHEFQMVGVNRELDPEIETIFLPAHPLSNSISSSVVRQIYAAGGDLKKFIHPSILEFFH